MSRFYDHAVTDLALSETHWIKGKRLVVKRFDQSCRERNFSDLMPQDSDDPNVFAFIKSKKSKTKKGKENFEYNIVEDGSTQDIDIKDVNDDEKKDDDVNDDEKKDAIVNDDEKKDDENSQDPDHKRTPIIDPESEQKQSQKQSPLGGGNESTSTPNSIEELQVTTVAECESNKEGIFFRNKDF